MFKRLEVKRKRIREDARITSTGITLSSSFVQENKLQDEKLVIVYQDLGNHTLALRFTDGGADARIVTHTRNSISRCISCVDVLRESYAKVGMGIDITKQQIIFNKAEGPVTAYAMDFAESHKI